jgi:hypothetical protein
MNNLFPCKIEVTCKNLLHEGTCLLLSKSFLDQLAEIRIAQLCDYVGIVFGGKDLVQGEYMWLALELL